jgi:uncharacterized membrane protein YphA (DoxX/SURF4 family)
MRLVVGIALVVRRIIELQSAAPISLAVIHVLAIAAGILLLAGLWTPIAGALAMLGPGAWSVDARLFGWKRIDLRDRKS